MRKTLSLTSAAILLITLSACSTGSNGDGRECLPVSAEVMESLAEGSNQYPITPIAAAAVRSAERADVNIIAMSFTEDAGDDEVLEGVWAVGGNLADYPGIGPWLAIDGVADLYSDYPNQMNGEKFTAAEDGAAEALECLAAL